MNKAFVREPEFDGRAFCPRCGSLGTAVGRTTLDYHVRPDCRSRMGDTAWFCGFARCEAAYFDLFDAVVTVAELSGGVYPKDPSAPICACFGFTLDDLEADVREGTPTRIRELLAKARSAAAACGARAADGQSCVREVQRLYLKRTAGSDP